MKIDKYIIVASILIFVVFAAYFIRFYIVLGYGISGDTADWGQLGSYIGGILSPMLSFVSIVLLIKSLTLQNETNTSLKIELKNNEKTEKLRSFEVLFFNLVNSQKDLFESFRIEISLKNKIIHPEKVKAVMDIEDKIEEIKDAGGGAQEVKSYISDIDKYDQIFGLTRAFYVLVLMVTEKLSDLEGFSIEDRKTHFITLVNFTDFAQLRLIMMCIQFMDYESSKYLRSSTEFKNVIEELGLGYDLY